MPYTSLKIETINTGEQAGTWGQTTNTNLGTALPEAITGRATATFTSDTNLPLPYDDTNASQVFRNLVLNVVSSSNLSATRDLVIPAIEKQYFIENNTSGGQSIRVKTSSGTGVTIPNGRKANVFCDGTNTRFADDYVDINGGNIDNTPIGASTASTGVFTVLTATTGNIDTVNATTGNIDTINVTTLNADDINVTSFDVDTLNVGTQTNKATISYTTNAARTLTIPAVSGNRTFAFLDEAQTFTANQTIGANLVFSGNTRRLQAKFDSQNVDGFLLQHSTPTSGTSLGLIPGTSSIQSDTSLILYSSTDPVNSSYFAAYSSPSITFIETQSVGTATTQDFYIATDGLGRINIDATTGYIGINQAPEALNYVLAVAGSGAEGVKFNCGLVVFTQQYAQTVSGSPRNLYINTNGAIGGISSTRESKGNIAAIEDSSWLMQLEPVSFSRRKQNASGAFTEELYDEVEFGLIAEDVEKVRPELCIKAVKDGQEKLSGIHYEQLIAPMIKEIQNLRAEIEALKAKGN
jgi:hypothetical protein